MVSLQSNKGVCEGQAPPFGIHKFGLAALSWESSVILWWLKKNLLGMGGDVMVKLCKTKLQSAENVSSSALLVLKIFLPYFCYFFHNCI